MMILCLVRSLEVVLSWEGRFFDSFLVSCLVIGRGLFYFVLMSCLVIGRE